MYLKPAQKPVPPIWIAASSDETLIKSGELGFPIMGIPFARSNTVLDVKEKNDLFRESYFRAGHKEEPDVIVALHVYLRLNDEEAVRFGRPHFERALQFHKTHRRPGSKVVDFDNVQKERSVVFSSPAGAEAIFREYQSIGVTHLICMVNFGGVPMEDVRRTMELVSTELMPRLR